MPPTKLILAFLFFFTATACQADHHAEPGSAKKAGSSAKDDGWIELFNGKDLTGWKAVENPKSFRVEDGQIVANGERSHLFYVGPVEKANFRDFMWECEVMLLPGSNSGMYFHTKLQEKGWPTHGYEAQLNNTQHDRKKTGGLYDVADVLDQSPAKDNEWFTQRVVVRGKWVRVYVNGKLTADYHEPDNVERPEKRKHRRLSSGTLALQGHDPDSTVRFRSIRVKPLASVGSGAKGDAYGG